MSDDPKKSEQAPDANRAPGQETPSRSYGRQVHEENDGDSTTGKEQSERSKNQSSASGQKQRTND